jgi:hypothetical protein
VIYLGGLALVTAAALALSAALPAEAGLGLRRALGPALLVQAPLGWWVVRSLGTPAFMAAWVLGMMGRFAVVGLTAMVAAPLLDWALEPVLVSLAALLFAYLGLECLMVVLIAPRAGARKETQAEER